jgi:molybdopterin synthase sulfur carrier subunit
VKARVLYFAAVRDLVGRDEEDVDLPDDVRTIRDFAAWIARRRPALEGRMAHVRIARNESFAEAPDPLGEGDVLALIPPVAGG